MSVLLDLKKINSEQLKKIDNELDISIDKNFIQPYRITQNMAFIPFSYGITNGFVPIKHRKLTQPLEFIGVLREEQKKVRDEIINILNKNKCIILSTHVGFGKSILATYFSYKIQMKTLIVVNRLVLIKQWEEVLNKFIKNPKLQIIKTNELIDWECDFFIVNAININKIGYMPEIGLMIVDELHLIVSKILSTCFQYVTPTYLIGLSATPYRTDGFDKLINLYFGEERIDRRLKREHIVYRLNTNFTPIMNKQNNGKVDWNDILKQQALDEKRNNLIINKLLEYSNLNFMVLCKRVEQIKILQAKLADRNIDAEYIYGDKQPDITLKSKILIGTIQKLGTGFDAPWLNALLIAADLEAYFIQYLGRVFRKQEVIPIVFDLVDNNPILKKHYKTREQTYIEHGGKIFII